MKNKFLTKKIIVAAIILIISLISTLPINGENTTSENGGEIASVPLNEDINQIQENENVYFENIINNQTEKEIANTSDNENITKKEDLNQSFNISEKDLINQTQNENLTINDNETSIINEDNSKNSKNEGNKNKDNETGIEYVNLDEIYENKTEESKEKIKLICFKDSKKVFEGEIEKDIQCDEINKTDIIKSDSLIEVTIKSENHLEDPITVYTPIRDLSENQKEFVEVFWKNEGRNIESFDFYDRDNNGFYEEISWNVPHLSEQIFEIIINLTAINTSSEIIRIDSNKIPPINSKNPIEFEFSIEYKELENLQCYFNGPTNKTINSTNSFSQSYENLENGNYSWNFSCQDKNNLTIKNSTSGNFFINENFYTSGLKEVYLSGENLEFTLPNEYNQTKIELFKNNQIIYGPVNFYTPSIILNGNILSEVGDYTMRINSSGNNTSKTKINKTFSVIKIELDKNKQNLKTDEEVIADIIINSTFILTNPIIIDFGDGKTNISYPNNNNIGLKIAHKYDSAGNYVIKLLTTIKSRTFTIEETSLSVEKKDDDDDPKIELISPKNNAIVDTSSLTFSFKVKDNSDIESCTFELYNYSEGWGKLDYSQTKEDITVNQTTEIRLANFKEQDYSWNVFCCDNSSNCNDWSDYNRNFKVSFLNSASGSSINSQSRIKTVSYGEEYEGKEELEEIITNLENFLKEREDYDLKKIEILDNLEISKDLSYYQKRLTQIRIDLSDNINYIEESKRESRRQELIKEYQEINNKVPLQISILKEQEFVKNSITSDLDGILQEYIDSKGIKDEVSLKTLRNNAKKSQNKIKVLTKVAQIELKYPNETRELTLITKTIESEKNEGDIIIEVIPKNLEKEEIIFLNEKENVKENRIYSFSNEDLKEDKIIYYLEKYIDPKEIENTETILFEKNIEQIKITGFAVYIDELNFGYYYIALIILIIIFILIIFNFIKRSRIKEWKKDENVRQIFELKKQVEISLKNKNTVNSRENYEKIEKLYPLIPEKCKSYLKKDLKRIKLYLDKKEIRGLIEEYNSALSQGRAEDTRMIYQKIREIYPRLPKEQKERVYNKIFRSKDIYY